MNIQSSSSAQQIALCLLDNDEMFFEQFNLLHFKFNESTLSLCHKDEAQFSALFDWYLGDHFELCTDQEFIKDQLNLIPTSEINFYLNLYAPFSHVDVATAYISGKVDFWKKVGSFWNKCDENACEWISLCEDCDKLKALPRGYPKEFVFMELRRRANKFHGLTPDQCESVDDFMEYYQPGVKEISRHCSVKEWYDEGGGFIYEKCRVITFQGDKYAVKEDAAHDLEHEKRNSSWMKNGKYHRLSGPAVIKYFDPHIDTEGHLAADEKSYYVEGKLTEYKDDTYETIERHWPSNKQAYFGINL